MQSLCGVEFYRIPLEVLLLQISLNHLLLLLVTLDLQRVVRQEHFLIVLDDNAAEGTAPLYHLLLGLQEDDVEGVLSDGVFAHGSEHLECPRELLSVAHVERSVLLEVLVEGVKDSLKMHDFIGVGVGILNKGIFTLSLMKSRKIFSSTTLFLLSTVSGMPRVILLYFSLEVYP